METFCAFQNKHCWRHCRSSCKVWMEPDPLFSVCRQVVLTSNCNLLSAALTGLVTAARCCINKSGRLTQLIPLDLSDKSQCAVAAGLFWQARWLGFLLHFYKMSSGHGSVRCLPLFFTHFCLHSVVLFIKRSSNSAEEKRDWQKATKQLLLTWTEDLEIYAAVRLQAS